MHKTKIKRITLSLLAIVTTGALTVGISRALFQDQETVNSSFSLGTLNLKVGDSDPATVALDFTDMYPGQEREFSLNLVNTGQVDGNFWLEGVVISSLENLNPQAETDIEEPGDLDDCAKMSIEVDDVHGDTNILASDVYLKDMQQSLETEAQTTVDEAVNHGPAPMRIKVDTHECGSEAMGDTVEMEFEFNLDQDV